MGFLKKILGICETKPPADAGCWSYNAGKVELDLKRAPELSRKGGAVRLEGGALPERLLVLLGEDGEIHAFRNKCTHGGRRLDPLPGRNEVKCCSVGQSVFDYDGANLSGSAKKPIHPLPVERKGDQISIKI